MSLQKYKIDFLTFTTDGQVKSDCADITFYNNGATNIILNNSVLITPGNSLSLAANFNEIDLTLYQFYFIPSGTRVNKLVVFRKIYV
jgi:hypothetical protein